MEKRHRIRFTNSLLAAVGGVLLCFVVMYAHGLGHVIIDDLLLLAIFGIFWGVNLWILWAVGSGYSDRFADGSLTLLQMYWAALSCVFAMVIVKGHYEVFLILLFSVMVFGIFRMRGKDYFVYSAVVSLCFAIQQGVSFLIQYEPLASLDRLVMWLVFTICAATLSTLCHSLSLMRLRLHEKNEQLAEALGTKNLFMANMSHEVRTPINGVIGMLRLLQRSSLQDEQRHQVSLALSSAQNLLGVVNDVLDFSNIEAGKMELDSVEFDLRELLSDIARTMAVRAQEKEIEFVLDVAQISASRVRGDPGRLHQILMNLLGNAIKFTQYGEISLACKLTSINDRQHVLQCSVKDTGIGIAQENIDKIFSSFSQVDASTTRRFGGAGLGLTLAKQLCELMGGSIRIQSEIGYGSEFIFAVNLDVCVNAKNYGVPDALENKRVLVVDANATSNNMLCKQLKAWGAVVKQAYEHDAALGEIYDTVNNGKAQTFAAIFVDAGIVSSTGSSFAESVRQDRDFDSVGTVTLLRTETEAVSAQVGRPFIDLRLRKPITPGPLAEAVQSLFSPHVQAGLSSDNASGESCMAANGREASGKDSSVNSPSTSDSAGPKAHAKILLVEDNAVNRQVAEGLLEQFGLSCDKAENGQIALEKLHASKRSGSLYHLILMDCQMPVMDGYEATRQIRSGACGEDYRYIPIVAVTANVMAGDREKCLNAGMNDYLPKPLELNELAKKLTQWLGVVKLKSNVVEFSKSAKDKSLVLWDEPAAMRRVGGKQERLHYLIKLFLKSTPKELEELKFAFGSQDYDKLSLNAHSIKGVAGNMGAMKLMDSALNCEKLSKSRNVEQLQDAIPALSQCFDETVQALQQYLKTSSAKG